MKNKILVISTCDPEKTEILICLLIASKNRLSCPPCRTSLNIRPRSSRQRRDTMAARPHNVFLGKELTLKILDKKNWQPRTHQSEELLPAIDKLLKENKIKTQNLGLIMVNTGPGSFTGTRVGVATANALGFSLDIPVVGISSKKEIEDVLSAGLKLWQKRKIKKNIPVKPFYNQAPNITTPKK